MNAEPTNRDHQRDEGVVLTLAAPFLRKKAEYRSERRDRKLTNKSSAIRWQQRGRLTKTGAGDVLLFGGEVA
jgi:hypothetical protein